MLSSVTKNKTIPSKDVQSNHWKIHETNYGRLSVKYSRISTDGHLSTTTTSLQWQRQLKRIPIAKTTSAQWQVNQRWMHGLNLIFLMEKVTKILICIMHIIGLHFHLVSVSYKQESQILLKLTPSGLSIVVHNMARCEKNDPGFVCKVLYITNTGAFF